eukprot:1914995-Ditylum_brightwellii.AAC.1
MLEILEKGMTRNFVDVVDIFERESNIEYMTAYVQAREEKVNWRKCYNTSIVVVNSVPTGLTPVVRRQTIMDWFFDFKTHGCKFIVPSVVLKDEHKLPNTFEVYPDFKEACVKVIDGNIWNITIAIVHRYTINC